MGVVKKLAIDLGTTNSIVWKEGEGIVVDEPSLVAVASGTNKVLTVGSEAREMEGRSPEYIEIVRPVKDGVVADYEIAREMLRWLMRKAMGKWWLFKPEVMICAPAEITQVEQKALVDAALEAGARRAYLIDAPLAAAIGARIPVSEAGGNMVVNIGGGSMEAAIISLGGVIVSKSARIGGSRFDEEISVMIRKNHNLLVGGSVAEEVKIKIGSAIRPKHEKVLQIGGRDTINGLPKTIEIGSIEVYETIKQTLETVVEIVRETLSVAAPELVSDVIDQGIVLSGGGAELKDLDKYISNEIGVAVSLVAEPRMCVIKGTALAVENLDIYYRALRQ